jgi:hypothetical protein
MHQRAQLGPRRRRRAAAILLKIDLLFGWPSDPS